MHSAEAQQDETEKVEQVNRCCRTLTEKGREYRISILDKKKSSLVSKTIRKSSEINDLLHSYENATTVKKESSKLNNIYKLIVQINDEMTEIYVNYSEEFWFAEINEKVFSFKHKIHDWLREGKNGVKREKSSKSSGSILKLSGLSRSTRSRSSRMSSKEKAMQEKVRVAELRTKASFRKKKREAESQAKAEARVKIYDQEKLEAKVQNEKLVVTEESGKTIRVRNYTWNRPLLTEQRNQRKNWMIWRDRHQRDKKTSNKEGIEMTTTQNALNIGNQNEMVSQS